jgi:hypothetical protein
MAKNVKILRFLNEELIAEVVGETDTTIEVKNPLRIVVMPNKADPSNPNIGFAPYSEWIADKQLTLSKNMLVYTAEPITVFLNQYNSQFGGIVVPDTKIIT